LFIGYTFEQCCHNNATVTYSGGQWEGVQAAVALRTTLSKLECLPVSAMVHYIPKAQDVLTAFQLWSQI
jgi:hypothetical protein